MSSRTKNHKGKGFSCKCDRLTQSHGKTQQGEQTFGCCNKSSTKGSKAYCCSVLKFCYIPAIQNQKATTKSSTVGQVRRGRVSTNSSAAGRSKSDLGGDPEVARRSWLRAAAAAPRKRRGIWGGGEETTGAEKTTGAKGQQH